MARSRMYLFVPDDECSVSILLGFFLGKHCDVNTIIENNLRMISTFPV